MLEQIVEIKYAVTLLGAQVAVREQAAEPPPGRTVARIGEDIGRVVGKDQARAGLTGERQFLFSLDEMGPHHAGDGIAIAEPDSIKPDMDCLQHQLLGMRGATQKGKIRGDGEFEISHAYIPCRNKRGVGSAMSR